MNLELDFRSGIPIYIQVVEHIKQLLASGSLKSGDQLPTVRALALELRVNFNTIARAYRILDDAGIISTQQGRGTYIMEMPPPEISENIRQQALRAITHRYLADALRLSATPEDVLETVVEQVEKWKDTGSLIDFEELIKKGERYEPDDQ